MGTATLNGDKLMVVEPGNYTLTLTYTLADGQKQTVEVGKYQVDELTTVPKLLNYLSGGDDGDGTTTWEWNGNASAVWGNGPFGSGKNLSGGLYLIMTLKAKVVARLVV